MSEFSDAFAEASLPQLLEVHGQSVTYTKVTGGSQILTAIVRDGPGGERDFGDGPVEVSTKFISGLLAVDVPDPRRGDVWRIDGEDWGYDHVAGATFKAVGVMVPVFRSLAINKSRRDRETRR